MSSIRRNEKLGRPESIKDSVSKVRYGIDFIFAQLKANNVLEQPEAGEDGSFTITHNVKLPHSIYSRNMRLVKKTDSMGCTVEDRIEFYDFKDTENTALLEYYLLDSESDTVFNFRFEKACGEYIQTTVNPENRADASKFNRICDLIGSYRFTQSFSIEEASKPESTTPEKTVEEIMVPNVAGASKDSRIARLLTELKIF
jgi:hypothetical protein